MDTGMCTCTHRDSSVSYNASMYPDLKVRSRQSFDVEGRGSAPTCWRTPQLPHAQSPGDSLRSSSRFLSVVSLTASQPFHPVMVLLLRCSQSSSPNTVIIHLESLQPHERERKGVHKPGRKRLGFYSCNRRFGNREFWGD